jgi:hypothetical protein
VEKLRQYPRVLARFVEAVGLPAYWNVPNRNEFFEGREDHLEWLGEHLSSAQGVAITQAIAGLGGVGKTQVAIEYCHRH